MTYFYDIKDSITYKHKIMLSAVRSLENWESYIINYWHVRSGLEMVIAKKFITYVSRIAWNNVKSNYEYEILQFFGGKNHTAWNLTDHICYPCCMHIYKDWAEIYAVL